MQTVRKKLEGMSMVLLLEMTACANQQEGHHRRQKDSVDATCCREREHNMKSLEANNIRTKFSFCISLIYITAHRKPIASSKSAEAKVPATSCMPFT